VGRGVLVGGLQDFPNTKDVPHYALMARDDLVVGPIQGDGAAMHGRSPLTADGVIRLETGFVRDGDPTSAALESYDAPGGSVLPAVDAHSSVLQRGTGAFQNVVAVITGGRAELFAPDQHYLAGGTPVQISGIEASGYAPQYVEVP
jgi:hypothetical protein